MRTITVLSGKGGTGKTTLSASLVELSRRCIAVDCDTGASNLHLLLQSRTMSNEDLYLGSTAQRDDSACISCGACRKSCAFHAAGEPIDTSLCQGCGVCTLVCPVDAVKLVNRYDGIWKRSETENGMMFHADMVPGAESSGKLVTLLKHHAYAYAQKHQYSLTICDGPPGIGCPVIASITGSSEVVLVTEPTEAAFADIQRIIELVENFSIPMYVCINRWDIWKEMTCRIEAYCRKHSVPVLGKIRYDPGIREALNSGMSPVRADIPSRNDVIHIYTALIQ